jgi:hypothetical protein
MHKLARLALAVPKRYFKCPHINTEIIGHSFLREIWIYRKSIINLPNSKD